MPHMDNDHPDRFDAIEDQIVSVHPVADAFGFVSRHQRKALGKIGQTKARGAKLLDEGERALRIVQGSPVADFL